MNRLRRYLIAGILVWVPLGVTWLVLSFLLGLVDRTLLLLPPRLRPENLVGFRIPGLGLILTLTLLVVTGLLARNFVGHRLVRLWESFLDRIPLVRWVYSGAKKIAETVLSPQGQAFRKVLLVQYPSRGVWSLAFQTASELGEVQEKTGKDVICAFVPTTPNPTSGFIVFVPRDEVMELDMAVEDALRMIISLGVIVPEERRRKLPVKPQQAIP